MDSLLDRRSWLRWSLKCSCLLGLGSFTYAGFSFLRAEAPETEKRDEPEGEPPGPESDGAETASNPAAPSALGDSANGTTQADGIPPGGSKMVAFGSTPVIVVREEAGLRAFGAVCTHLGCLVKWNPSTRTFDCPCHGGKYDSDGKVLSGPPPRDLAEYPLSAIGQALAASPRAAAGGHGGRAG